MHYSIREVISMELRILRYFLAVAREENITRAAESLHISQPSLSKQLIELEREVGKPLLIRGKRKITLTEDGTHLRKRAEEILTLMEKTERELHTDAAGIRGEVAIGGNPTPSLLRIAAGIRDTFPGIRFGFYSSDATDVLERLDHGSLDFAVVLEPADSLHWESLPLPEASRWGLLMPVTCPLAQKSSVSKDSFSAVPLILHRRAGLQQLISRWAETEVENLNVAATYNVINGSPERFVRSGLGSFLTTEDLLPAYPGNDLCFRPLDPPLETHYCLIWKTHTTLSKSAALFLETCKGKLSPETAKFPADD